MTAVLDPATMVTPGHIVDVLSTDQGTVVLVESEAEHRVVRLSLLGSEILDAVGCGTSITALEDELRHRLGDPPDGEIGPALHRALVSLAELEVVQIGSKHLFDT